jgi:hypothetical protein
MTATDKSGASTAIVALGGNALLRSGEPLEAANQARAARETARIIGAASLHHRLVITRGNGPQVGMLALMSDAYTDTKLLHCLPAFHDKKTAVGREIMEHTGLEDGLEVTDEVFESARSIVFDQAENRLHTIKAVLVATLETS